MNDQLQRIGICFADADTFWWNADRDAVCPACPQDEEEYAANHKFFVAEDSGYVTIVAALAVYGEGVNLPALVEKARALNQAQT
jgi:hypothetical protein